MIDIFPVTALGEERLARVYVPEGDGPFPVLYLFDGQTAFSDKSAPYGKAIKIHEILQKLGIRMIVAAVDCSKKNRLDEYAPISFTYEKVTYMGHGQHTMEWLTGEFKPLVDSRYPTLPDRKNTAVMGSSMGGLMALAAIAGYANYFSAAVALSPSIWTFPRGGELLKFVNPNVEVYFDYGEKELRAHAGTERKLLQTAKCLMDRGAKFTFTIAKGGEHNEKSWAARLPAALTSLAFFRRFQE